MSRSHLPDILGPASIVRLLEAGGPRHTPWLLLGADAGLRTGEIIRVCPTWLIEPGLLYILGKGRRVRHVPTTPRLLSALQTEAFNRAAWGIGPSVPYVPVTARTVQRWFRGLAMAAGVYLPGRTPHSLRHSYATRLVQAGVPINVIARLLGHSSISTTQIYLHAAKDEIFHAVRRLAEHDLSHSPKNATSRQAPLFAPETWVPDSWHRPLSFRGRKRHG